jgi:Cu-Zn family superoxide dismutase
MRGHQFKPGRPIMKTMLILTAALLLAAGNVVAGETTVQMHLLTESGSGENIGRVTISDGSHGLLLIPDLQGLPEGIHGFHIHQKPDCGAVMKEGASIPGLAAGGHIDPFNTESHQGPYGQGHLGDLPALYVDSSGRADLPLLAPRLKTDFLKGRALILHGGGDNYSDVPKKLGGGGARIACGVIH